MQDATSRTPARRPQVVAHRGSSASHAEHTLGAYVQALDEGAEALECDVRLTADGHLVCVHDRSIRRTSTGRGVVAELGLEQLNQLDFAAWKNPWADLDDEAPEVDEEYRRVLTLQRLLQVVRDYDRQVDVAIETKHPTRYDGLVEQRVVEALREFGWAGPDSPARVMSFSWIALQRVSRLAPDLERVFLIDDVGPRYVTGRLAMGEWIAGPGLQFLKENPKFGRRLSRSGRRIHVWTVNTPEDLDLCVALGAEAVITDRPALAMTHLSRIV